MGGFYQHVFIRKLFSIFEMDCSPSCRRKCNPKIAFNVPKNIITMYFGKTNNENVVHLGV